MSNGNQLKVLLVSSSLDPESRSERLVLRAQDLLGKRAATKFVTLKNYRLDGADLYRPLESASYRELHSLVIEADSLVLGSPVYNWSVCSELKRFIELVGTTPPDGSVSSAFFDKVVTFLNTGGGNFSYTAFTGIASSMMLDFKCIINPYNVYAENNDWIDGAFSTRIEDRLVKSIDVMVELTTLLKDRTYRSGWEL